MKLLSSRCTASLWRTMVRAAILVSVPFLAPSVLAEPVPPGTAEQIRERLAPAGALCRAGDDCGVAAVASASGPRGGKQVYDQFCFACHTTGVGGAPLLTDTGAWSEREAKGMDALWTSLVDGIGAMPAKGTCMDCSDDELQEVLDYMLAGGNP